MLGRIFWEEGGVDIRVKVKNQVWKKKNTHLFWFFSSNNLRNNPSI